MEALDSEDSYLRCMAAESLGTIGDKAAVPALLKTLSADDPWVKGYVVEALGKIGDGRAVEPLIETMRSGGSGIRREGARALTGIGKPAIKPLIQTLSEDDGEMKASAAWVLAMAGELLGPAPHRCPQAGGRRVPEGRRGGPLRDRGARPRAPHRRPRRLP